METGRLVDLQASGRSVVDDPGSSVSRLSRGLLPIRPWLMLTWAGVFGLLFLAFRRVPLAAITQVINQLKPGQILLLILVNLGFLLLVNARWAVLLLSLGWKVPLSKLMLYRLAGFGVSYFSLGPQFGGEPVQVFLLHRNEGVPLTAAISSVFLDRLVDLLSNFLFLFLGGLVVLVSGVVSGWQGSLIEVLMLILVLMPAGLLLAFSQEKKPFTWLVGRLQTRWSFLQRIREPVSQSEEQIAGLVRTRPATLAGMMVISGLVWCLAVLEFWLYLRFFGIIPGIGEVVSSLTAARLSFLLPLPGGLGALEASQSLATQLLGWGPVIGIAVSLVIRARDILLALIGLGVSGFTYRSFLFRRLGSKERS